MNIFNEGDKSKAICYNCETLVDTTFKYMDVPFSDGTGVAENILVGVCDVCSKVVSSTPNIF